MLANTDKSFSSKDLPAVTITTYMYMYISTMNGLIMTIQIQTNMTIEQQ